MSGQRPARSWRRSGAAGLRGARTPPPQAAQAKRPLRQYPGAPPCRVFLPVTRGCLRHGMLRRVWGSPSSGSARRSTGPRGLAPKVCGHQHPIGAQGRVHRWNRRGCGGQRSLCASGRGRRSRLDAEHGRCPDPPGSCGRRWASTHARSRPHRSDHGCRGLDRLRAQGLRAADAAARCHPLTGAEGQA